MYTSCLKIAQGSFLTENNPLLREKKISTVQYNSNFFWITKYYVCHNTPLYATPPSMTSWVYCLCSGEGEHAL